METDRVQAALALATAAHDGQFRLYDGDPYITHPVAVAEMVAADGGDENEVIAALLHDVVEDTDVTLAEVHAHFGDDVASLVDALTKRKPEGEEHFDYIDRVIAAGPRARRIKQADTLHNGSTLPPDHGLHKRFDKTLRLLAAANH
jgi:GTP diphosphokinase / guanosine-3',5'-bis(diphosphate) 3'-diphosphatase